MVSLAVAVAATLVLFFGNFTLAYLFQALRGERIPLGSFAGVLLVTALAVGTLLWGGRRWWRYSHPTATPPEVSTGYVTPLPQPASGTTPPPAADGATSDRWLLARARNRLLELAESPEGFTLDQALADTALEPTDLTYLIDELIGARRLRAVASGHNFRYRLREPSESEPR